LVYIISLCICNGVFVYAIYLCLIFIRVLDFGSDFTQPYKIDLWAERCLLLIKHVQVIYNPMWDSQHILLTPRTGHLGCHPSGSIVVGPIDLG
jgi:hypothetical protein